MAGYDTSLLEKSLEKWGLQVNGRQMDQLISYYELLVERNQVMNLTAITKWEDVIQKHFVDSLSLIHVFQISTNIDMIKMIDIGTGAGFPGVPLKIMFPGLEVTLLDSLKKRVLFLEELIDRLELVNIRAIHGRAEEFAKQNDHREIYDLCVSRAVANLSTLSELCLPFVKIGGFFISYKAEKVLEEGRSAEYAIEILGGKIDKQEEFTLPFSDIKRNLFIISKLNNTPKAYPRKSGTPAKIPLSEIKK